jgi:tetratricopeptide (TPR) repeat protein
MHADLVDAYLLRARAYTRLAQYAEARTDYQMFLQHKPAHTGAHDALAWLLATCPDAKIRAPTEAIEFAKKAIKLAPNVEKHWQTLGVAHYRAGDARAAIVALDKALALRQHRDAVDWLFLAMAQRTLGKAEEAHKAYEEAVQWLARNEASLEEERAEEIHRFRAEAEKVLGRVAPGGHSPEAPTDPDVRS